MTYDLVLNQDCNLECVYCFENNKKTISMHENQIKLIKKFMMSYITNDFVINKKEIKINFTGGEPLINYNILKKIYLETNDFVQQYSISTNFLLITRPMLDFFSGINIHLHISIDGKKETNDKYRVLKNGKGTFDTLFGNIKMLQDEYPKIETSYSMVYTPQSVRQLAENIEFLYDSGIRYIYASYASNYFWDQESINEYIIQLNRISSLYKYAYDNKDPFYFSIFSDLIYNAITLKGQVSRCGAFRDTITILPNGDILPCLLFLGNDLQNKISFSSIFEKIDSDRINSFLENTKQTAKTCLTCALYGRCHTTCFFSFQQDKKNKYSISGLNCQINQFSIFEADNILQYLLTSKNETFKNQYNNFL